MLPSVDRVDAVLCDAGGVLLMPDPDVLRSLLESTGLCPTDAVCERAHFEAMRALDQHGHTAYSVGHRAFARSIGATPAQLEDAAAAVGQLYTRHPLKPVPTAAPSLQRLAEAGLALGVVSNASGTMADQLAAHEICSVGGTGGVTVAVVVDSEIVGIEKPDPGIFQIALDALRVPASRCVYIGDSVHFDVHGARAAGLHPVHVDPHELCGDPTHLHAASVSQFTDSFLASKD